MKRLIMALGWLLLITIVLSAVGLEALVVVPIQIAFHLTFGWFWFLRRVLPEAHVNPAAVMFFLLATILVVAAIHWLGRSLSAVRGGRWPRRWSLGVYASTWLLFLTAMGVTGVAHQAGWLWRSGEPWGSEKNKTVRSSMDMHIIVKGIELAVQEQAPDHDRDASEIRPDVIKAISPALDSCYFQLFPPDEGPFRAAVVRPRSQEALNRYGFFLVRKVGRATHPTKLGAGELEPALKELTAGRDYKPASDPTEPAGTDR